MAMDCVAVILAAGKGTRMKSDLPKVAHELRGQPLVLHVTDLCRELGIPRVIVVVGYGAEIVRAALPPGVESALQAEQLGTGHAIMCAEEALAGETRDLLVLYGDMPLLRAETIRSLAACHREGGFAVTVLTAVMDDPAAYGRIIRAADGTLEAIVEFKDATPEQRAIREVNTGIYFFRTAPLLQVLHGIRADNAQKEYYLTDAVRLLREAGYAAGAFVAADSGEALGVNDLEDLAAAGRELERRAGQC